MRSLRSRDIALRAEGEQPLAAAAVAAVRRYPPPPAPPPLEPPLLAKRSLEQETQMTDAVGLKCIDTNKGSAEAPRYRSRLVFTEVRQTGVEPIFPATPPLETLRVLISVACQTCFELRTLS